jgi:Ras-related protein Rab-4B
MPRPRATSTSSEVSSAPSSSAAAATAPQELSSMYDYLAKIILLGPSGTGKSCLLHRFVKQEWRVLSSQTIGVEFSSKIVKIGSPHSPSRRRIKLQLWDTAGTERFRSVSRSYYRGAAGAILVYDVASLNSFQALPTFLMDARSLASPGLTVVLAGNKADLADPNSSSASNGRNNTNAAGGSSIPQSANGSWKDAPPTPSASSVASSVNTATGTGRSRTDSLNLSNLTGTKWTATQPNVEGGGGREVSPDVASRWASKAGVPAIMDVSALTGENVDELFNRLARMILTKIELGEIDPDDPNSGIQYGDIGWGDGESMAGSTATGEDGQGGTLRRRKKRSKVLLNGMGEWGDVFRKPGSSRRGCC